jgi:putative DNA primase/helicase
MSPFFREDGTLCATEGYDRASGAWLAMQGLALPPIPEQPSRAEAVLCIAKLKGLIVDFTFDNPSHTSVWLSLVLTSLARPLRSPLHLFNAANPGTGKGLICATAMAVAFGHRRVVQNWTASEEENEKRLVSLAVQGSPVVWIDNVAPNCVLGGAALEGGITEGSVGRELGSSRNAPALNNVTFLANGNNVRLSRDMGRRTLRAELVATCADPSARPASTFKIADLLDHVQENQAEYLAAALTVLRAYYAAGLPKVEVRSISFPEWSRTVASALVWVGEPDPSASCVMLAEKGAVDEATEALTTIMEAIKSLQGTGAVKPGALLAIPPADGLSERVSEALEVMGLRRDLDAAKVGRLLKSKEKAIVRLDSGEEVQLVKEKNSRTSAWEYRVVGLKKS